jgi:hypothetical protein
MTSSNIYNKCMQLEHDLLLLYDHGEIFNAETNKYLFKDIYTQLQ